MLAPAVIVGDSICGSRGSAKLESSSDDVYLKGFNTVSGYNPSDLTLSCEGTGEVVAAVNGYVEVTDKVVSVKGSLARYLPEIGDVVVGRIVEVSGNKWLVDIQGSQAASMLLSNVTEPGGMLRRRGRGDELGMRQLFDQEDLVVAEVQRISPDGVVSLHTRAAEKYGKLLSVGQLVAVKPSLIKRAKHQFVSLSKYNTQLIIGMNGRIWVSSSFTKLDTGMESESRHNIARIANCIRILGDAGVQIYPKTVEAAVEASTTAGLSSFDILLQTNRESLVTKVRDAAGLKRVRS